MRIAVYLRVSTNNQTSDNQIPDVENYLKQFPDADIVYFKENESAWKQGHQKELARLKVLIRSGRTKFDVLLLWAFDRLNRQGGFALIHEYEFFLTHGIRVISIKEPWTDVPKEFLPIMLSMAGYLAESESKRRSERTKAGLERVRKFGSKSGIGIGRRGPDKPETKRKKSGYYTRWLNKQRIGILHEVTGDNLDSEVMQNVIRN
jgi:putative DNA-invertase from lambdoid prophage Rac